MSTLENIFSFQIGQIKDTEQKQLHNLLITPVSVLTSLSEPRKPVEQFLQAGVVGQRAVRVRQHLTHTGQQQHTLSVHGDNLKHES